MKLNTNYITSKGTVVDVELRVSEELIKVNNKYDYRSVVSVIDIKTDFVSFEDRGYELRELKDLKISISDSRHFTYERKNNRETKTNSIIAVNSAVSTKYFYFNSSTTYFLFMKMIGKVPFDNLFIKYWFISISALSYIFIDMFDELNFPILLLMFFCLGLLFVCLNYKIKYDNKMMYLYEREQERKKRMEESVL
ncbi:hypothetical protein [Tenacibaculum sp. 190524A02b]|uniref:hypothetical protein n=1 Tax=Tenacibaculum vairaonense TaxID=3137860 RepID=UPI0031FB4160